MKSGDLSEAEIADLAERLLSYLSYDAVTWRPKYVDRPPGEPVQLTFTWVGDPRPYSDRLIEELHDRLRKPYVTDDWNVGADLLAGAAGGQCDAQAHLQERWHQDVQHLYYELVFTANDAVFAGFSPLRIGAG